MNGLRQAIDAATAVLAGAGIDSARTDAELLAAHLAGTDRGRLALADPPEPGFYPRFEQAVTARAARVPLQHITGTAPFGRHTLRVGPGVFIPRPETEALLEWALTRLPTRLPARTPGRAPVVVDLCTGSGALAIALAAELPDAQVIAVDDDPAALSYARANAPDGGAVRLVCGDVADAGLLPELAGAVDLVVANPPYIPAGAPLQPEVAEHDPPHALFGGADGMAVIAPVVARAAGWLRPGGLLAVEHDDTTAAATAAVIGRTGEFGDIESHLDLSGRPRFVTARRRGARG